MRRVNEAIREVLSARIAQGLNDPRIGFVTLTSVETSTDLRHARVYVSVLGDEAERAETLAALGSAEYGDAEACGTSYDLRGPNGEVRVQIVDRCVKCR